MGISNLKTGLHLITNSFKIINVKFLPLLSSQIVVLGNDTGFLLNIDGENVENIMKTISKGLCNSSFLEWGRAWVVWNTTLAFWISLLAQFLRVMRKRIQKI